MFLMHGKPSTHFLLLDNDLTMFHWKTLFLSALKPILLFNGEFSYSQRGEPELRSKWHHAETCPAHLQWLLIACKTSLSVSQNQISSAVLHGCSTIKRAEIHHSRNSEGCRAGHKVQPQDVMNIEKRGWLFWAVENNNFVSDFWGILEGIYGNVENR